VRFAVRRGRMATLTGCLLRLAAATPLMPVTGLTKTSSRNTPLIVPIEGVQLRVAVLQFKR
jgi:hypothetical protein